MKHKLIKKGVGLFLAFFLFISVPFDAFGASEDFSVKFIEYSITTTDGNKLTSNTTPSSIIDNSLKQNALKQAGFYFSIPSGYSEDYLYNITLVLQYARYKSFTVSVYAGQTQIDSFTATQNETTEDYSYTKAGDTYALFTYNVELPRAEYYAIYFNNFKYYNDEGNTFKLAYGIRGYSISIGDSKTNNLIGRISDGLKEVISSIKELPSKLGSFFTDLGNKITGLGTQISGFFSNLTNNLSTWFSNIGKWFTDLGNNIKTWFTNLTNNLKTWFDNVGNWITDFSQTVKDRFTYLFSAVDDWFQHLINMIYWGNPEGSLTYVKPVFKSGLTDVIKKLDEYCDSLDDTLGQIDNSKNVASDYIKQGTGVINDVLGVMPSAVIVLITFGIVFIFSRKVVGR